MSATDDLLQDHVFIRRLQTVIEKCYTMLYEGGDVPAEQVPSLGCGIKWKPGNEPT